MADRYTMNKKFISAISIFAGSMTLFIISIQLIPKAFVAPEQVNRVISHVNIIRPGQSRLKNHSVVIESGKIINIRPSLPTDPRSLCNNCFVMPGLIDAHVHTPPAIVPGNQRLFALMYLAHGVTSVRDVGRCWRGPRLRGQGLL